MYVKAQCFTHDQNQWYFERHLISGALLRITIQDRYIEYKNTDKDLL